MPATASDERFRRAAHIVATVMVIVLVGCTSVFVGRGALGDARSVIGEPQGSISLLTTDARVDTSLDVSLLADSDCSTGLAAIISLSFHTPADAVAAPRYLMLLEGDTRLTPAPRWSPFATSDGIQWSPAVEEVVHGQYTPYGTLVEPAQAVIGTVDDIGGTEVVGCTVTTDFVGVSSDRVSVQLPLLISGGDVDRHGRALPHRVVLTSAGSRRDLGSGWYGPTTLHVVANVQGVLPSDATIESSTPAVSAHGDASWSADGVLQASLVALDPEKQVALQHQVIIATMLFGALVSLLFALPRVTEAIRRDLADTGLRRWTVRGFGVWVLTLCGLWPALPGLIPEVLKPVSNVLPNRWQDDPAAVPFLAIGGFAAALLLFAGWWCGRQMRAGRTLLMFATALWIIASSLYAPTAPAVLTSWVFLAGAVGLSQVPVHRARWAKRPVASANV